jgi:hypothetical protein
MSARKNVEEAVERAEHARMPGGGRYALAAAVVAVIAAIGTLLGNHRSVQALDARSAASLAQARATFAVVSVVDEHKPQSLDAVVAQGRKLEEQASSAERRSDTLLSSYETIEYGTTICEIAIVFVSISALARKPWLFFTGLGAGVLSVAIIIIGELRH